MTEKPVVSHDLAYVNLPATEARPEDGRAPDGHSPYVAAVHAAGRPGIKQPRFAITAGKLREAFLHRWKSSVVVGLLLAGLGAGLAFATYKPKYTAMAMMQVEVPTTLTTSPSRHPAPRASQWASNAPTGIGMPGRRPNSEAHSGDRWPAR